MRLPKHAISACALLGLLLLTISACSTTPTHQALNATPGATTTICPAAGTARAAIVPPLSVGSHAALVYSTTDPNSADSLLQRVDVATGSITKIAHEYNGYIQQAQLSPDRQWILFLMAINGPHEHVELRLIRVDGQYEQTLFCLPVPSFRSSYISQLGEFSWSPDLASVAIIGFSGQYSLPAIYTIDLAQGQVQLTLASTIGPQEKTLSGTFPSFVEIYYPEKWLDATRLYVEGQKINGNYDPLQMAVYLLDTSNGANQQNSNLQRIISTKTPSTGPSICGFDTSSDGSQLFVAQCVYNNNTVLPQGTILAIPSGGGQAKTIFSTHAFGIVGLRVVDSQTLLLLTINAAGNGLSGSDIWKVHTDGSGLTHLASGRTLEWCSFLQSDCGTISPDGASYAITGYDDTGMPLFDGSISGGSVKQVAHMLGLYYSFIGWTNVP